MADDKNSKLRQSLSKTYPLFLKTFEQAKKSKDKILELCSKFESVYLIIEEEGDMDDMEILDLHKALKIYAGTAWTQIHKGRLEDGLYEAAREE